MLELNQRPSVSKTDALPTELTIIMWRIRASSLLHTLLRYRIQETYSCVLLRKSFLRVFSIGGASAPLFDQHASRTRFPNLALMD